MNVNPLWKAKLLTVCLAILLVVSGLNIAPQKVLKLNVDKVSTMNEIEICSFEENTIEEKYVSNCKYNGSFNNINLIKDGMQVQISGLFFVPFNINMQWYDLTLIGFLGMIFITKYMSIKMQN